MDAMSADALERIAAAPPGKWTPGDYATKRGCRCFVGHAADIRLGSDGFLTGSSLLRRGGMWAFFSEMGLPLWSVEIRFDRLVTRFGIRRLVPLIQARARKTLAAVDAP